MRSYCRAWAFITPKPGRITYRTPYPPLGGLEQAYRRFSAQDKYTVLVALDKLLAEGGTILGFSHAVHKAYSTLLR